MHICNEKILHWIFPIYINMNSPSFFWGWGGGGLQQLCQQLLLHPKQKQETFHTYQLSSPKHFIYQFSILKGLSHEIDFENVDEK
jgi:hypothetical protein